MFHSTNFNPSYYDMLNRSDYSSLETLLESYFYSNNSCY